MDDKHIIDLAVLSERICKLDTIYRERMTAIEEKFAISLAAMDRATVAAFAASEKAIVKAEIAQSNYNDRSNEFRGALDDQAKMMSQTMVPRREWEAGHTALIDKIDDVKDGLTDKADQKSLAALSKLVYIGVGMAVLLSFIVPVVVAFLKGR